MAYHDRITFYKKYLHEKLRVLSIQHLRKCFHDAMPSYGRVHEEEYQVGPSLHLYDVKYRCTAKRDVCMPLLSTSS